MYQADPYRQTLQRHRVDGVRKTYPFLGQLACLFVLRKIIIRKPAMSILIDWITYLGVSQQFQYSSFVWGESRDLANNGPHELVFGRLDALSLTWARGFGNGRCGVAFVGAITKV